MKVSRAGKSPPAGCNHVVRAAKALARFAGPESVEGSLHYDMSGISSFFPRLQGRWHTSSMNGKSRSSILWVYDVYSRALMLTSYAYVPGMSI